MDSLVDSEQLVAYRQNYLAIANNNVFKCACADCSGAYLDPPKGVFPSSTS
jgi:hypothetical protein